jgi:hypothetical protein
LVAVALLSALVTPWTAAGEVDLAPAGDTTIYEDPAGALSNGSGVHLFVGKTVNGDLRRALVRFDLASALPAGATVTSVRLALRVSKTISGPQTVALHRLLAEWGEGASDASGQEGAGAPAQQGDATWVHRFFDDAPWAAAGGDFAPAPSAEIAVGAIGSYAWESTPELVADVAAWLADPQQNFGWIVLGEEGENGSAKRFDSRENANAASRPRLTVGFTSPGAAFRRGDTNADGRVDIGDAVCALDHLFGANPSSACKQAVPHCLSGADANDDGAIDIADGVAILNHLFAGGGPLPPPFDACGDDPTADATSCADHAPCGGRG